MRGSMPGVLSALPRAASSAGAAARVVEAVPAGTAIATTSARPEDVGASHGGTVYLRPPTAAATCRR